MRKILIIIGRYLPGYKDGGPIRSIKNLTDKLGNEYEFYILTADRDRGDSDAYPGIEYEKWNQVGKAQVCYLRQGIYTPQIICEKSVGMDVVYLCGCFNDYARITLRLKKKGKILGKVVIAAMGLFSPGAFHMKYLKKKVYIEACKAMGYFKCVEWSATNEEEENNIRQIIGETSICHQAQDIPSQMEKFPVVIKKLENTLRIVFLSRISRKKNLDYALDILKEIKGNVIFDIYGAKEDEKYFEECTQKVKELPESIHCTYKGSVLPEKVIDIFSKYQVFFFPTRGENYGHVIFEALAGGCIPVLSDQTPWTELEKNEIGWTLPLANKVRFVEIIQKLVNMDSETCKVMQEKAVKYAWEYSKHVDCQGYRSIFEG